MITDLLQRNAARTPAAPFLWIDARSYSYAECFAAARQFAGLLQARGIGPGDHVAVLAGNSASYVIALLGVSWLGAVFVALNNELVGEGLRYSLTQSDARLVIADGRWIQEKSRHLDAALQGLPMVVLDADEKFFSALAAWPQAEGATVEGGDTCGILYTSGTTGLPKGVELSHDCYEATGRDTADLLRLSPADRIMVFLPLFHTNPQFMGLLPALWSGCSVIVRERFSASTFFDDAKRFGATGFTFVGTVMSILASRFPDQQRDHAMRFAMGGGTPVAIWEGVHERFGFRIHEGYGMTEVGCWVSANAAENYRLGSCGQVRACVEVRVVDAQDRPVPSGTAGEIVVRPREPNVILSGYYRKPEVLAQSSRNFWFHTGDRGSLDADGFLYFRGRSKELIRRGGEMISPAEIETWLRTLPGVRDCAAVGVADDIMGEEIKVVLVMDTQVPPAEVIAYLRSLVPRHMLPRYVEYLEKIPKTETEKVLRNLLTGLGPQVHDLGVRQPRT